MNMLAILISLVVTPVIAVLILLYYLIKFILTDEI